MRVPVMLVVHMAVLMLDEVVASVRVLVPLDSTPSG